MNRCIVWAMMIILLIAPTAYAGSAADDLAAAEAQYHALLNSERHTSTKSLWTQVIASFEDVVDDHPNSPEAPIALFRQGELYMEMFTYSITLGELLKAEKASRRVIAGYPAHELADEARAKLEEIDELRTRNCLVRVTPETNLAELLVPEETEATEAEEAQEPSNRESWWERRRNRETEEPETTDIPAPIEDDTPGDSTETVVAEATPVLETTDTPATTEDDTPNDSTETVVAEATPVLETTDIPAPTEDDASDDPIGTIIAEATPGPETTVPEEAAPAPTETETVAEEPSSPEPETQDEPDIPVTEDSSPGPETTEIDEPSPEPVVVAEAPAPPIDVEESFGIGSIEPVDASPEAETSEPLLLPVSALPEASDAGAPPESDEQTYDTATPVYTDGLPRPTTTPPVSDDTEHAHPSTPVDSLYAHYQEESGGTRMLTPAAPLVSTTAVTSIRYFTDTDHTRIVLDTDSAAAFFDSRLPENGDRGLPPRVYIDVFGAELALDRSGPIDIDDGFVHAVRWSQYNSETVRVVMDLEAPRDYRIFTLSEPNRVVIDILH